MQYFFQPPLAEQISMILKEGYISQTEVTAENRFTWAVIITNFYTVYALRVLVAEGGDGE